MSSPGIPTPVAIVTGASSGLGAIFAQRLGERGFNLVLAAARPTTGTHVDRRPGGFLRDLVPVRMSVHAAHSGSAPCPP